MRTYLLRRLLLTLLTLLAITLITFLISRLAPGGPIAQRVAMLQEQGQVMTEAQRETLQRLLGLDRPLAEQYVQWVWRAIRLDFGDSFSDLGIPVRDKLWRALQVSVPLQLAAVLLIYLIAVPIGVLSAVRQGSLVERATTIFLFLLYSVPNFFLASLLTLFLASGRYAELFPMLGLRSLDADQMSAGARLVDLLHHLVLPVICLTYAGLAGVSRFARSGMLEVIRQDYVRTARAKGLPERLVIARHALRNGIIPIATLVASLFPFLVGGSVIVETIFNLPGIGLLTYEAVINRDYPVVMATSTVVGVATLLGFVVSDLLYVWLNPRVALA